jgi:hypothetical protein
MQDIGCHPPLKPTEEEYIESGHCKSFTACEIIYLFSVISYRFGIGTLFIAEENMQVSRLIP